MEFLESHLHELQSRVLSGDNSCMTELLIALRSMNRDTEIEFFLRRAAQNDLQYKVLLAQELIRRAAGDANSALTQEAKELLMEATAQESPLPWHQLGLLSEQHNQGAMAQEYYRRAALLGYQPAIMNLSEMFMRLGETEFGQEWMDFGRDWPNKIAPTRAIFSIGELPDPLPVSLPQPERPAARLIRTPQDAEQAACLWMQWFGFKDAKVTPAGADGGIDVESEGAVAQVKLEGVPTGRPKIQALFGIASQKGVLGMFFSLSGYSQHALDFASEVEMPLFTFNLQGEPEPANIEAESWLFG